MGRDQGSGKEKMSTAVRIEHKDVEEIPFQEASLDIWDRKHRLTAKDGTPIDETMDDTLARVAKTLADVEEPSGDDRDSGMGAIRVRGKGVAGGARTARGIV